MEISIVLVGIKHSGNLGAIARLANNFDVRELILVNPECEIDDHAYERATWGRSYLDNIRIVPSLAVIKDDINLLIALSARIGGYTSLFRSSLSILQIPDQIRESRGVIGLVLGREDFGLSNSEIEQCDMVCHIPLPSDHQVLNISHAAGIALWELTRSTVVARNLNVEDEEMHQLMTRARQDAFFKFLSEILDHAWIKAERDTGVMRVFQSLFSRALMTEREANALVGTLRSIHKTVTRGHPPWDICTREKANET